MANKVLVIDRLQWARGQGDAALRSCLSGKMCCLGFDAVARGLTPAQIEGASRPEEVADRDDAPADYVRWAEDSGIAIEDAVTVNDDTSLADADREKQLLQILKQLGWDDVQFIN